MRGAADAYAARGESESRTMRVYVTTTTTSAGAAQLDVSDRERVRYRVVMALVYSSRVHVRVRRAMLCVVALTWRGTVGCVRSGRCDAAKRSAVSRSARARTEVLNGDARAT